MKKHLLHAILLSLPFLIISIVLLPDFVLKDVILTLMITFGIFLVSSLLLCGIYYLSYLKIKLALQLSKFLIIPFGIFLYRIVNDIITEGLGNSEATIIILPLFVNTIVYSLLYFYLSQKRVKEIYNSQ